MSTSRSPKADALLASPPNIALRVAGSAIATRRAFLELERKDLVATYPDGKSSEPFPYDAVVRKSMDAVIIIAYRIDAGVRRVYLRTSLRPPVALRFGENEAGLWELPAGLIDGDESPRDAASRELEEEVGFKIPADAFVELGPAAYPAPALIAEKHYFYAVDVTGYTASTPSEDGSPLERGADIVHHPIDALLEACRRGELPDSKTELGIRRFAEAT